MYGLHEENPKTGSPKITRAGRIVRIDRDHPDPDLITEAAALVRAGGIVAYLTDTLYGLGADALQESAVLRVFAAKARTAEKALPVIIGDRDFLWALALDISRDGKILMEKFWPGPLSLLLPATPAVPVALHGGTGRIAVRLPACAVARALATAAGGALTATSANRSGSSPARNAEEVMAALGDAIELVVDSGPAIIRLPSTLVDVTASPPRVLRAGAIPTDDIEDTLRSHSK